MSRRGSCECVSSRSRSRARLPSCQPFLNDSSHLVLSSLAHQAIQIASRDMAPQYFLGKVPGKPLRPPTTITNHQPPTTTHHHPPPPPPPSSARPPTPSPPHHHHTRLELGNHHPLTIPTPFHLSTCPPPHLLSHPSLQRLKWKKYCTRPSALPSHPYPQSDGVCCCVGQHGPCDPA